MARRIDYEELLRLAYHGALFLWNAAYEKSEKYPGNEIFREREQKCWEELDQVTKMYNDEYKRMKEVK